LNATAESLLITKDKDDIGMIVSALAFWHEAVASGAADLEHDVYDQTIYLP
jgi:hypothetical protein